MQLCDAAPTPAGDPLTEAMTNRLLPGDVVDFAAVLGCLRSMGAEPFYATEIFNPELVKRLGAVDTAHAMRAAALDVLT